MVTSFISICLSRLGFSFFQIKMKSEQRTANLNFNVHLFWKSKNDLVLFYVSTSVYKLKSKFYISFRISIYQKKKKKKKKKKKEKNKWHFRFTDFV